MEKVSKYLVYCSKCNREQKKKMSWKDYIYYRAMDGVSRGQHEIDNTIAKKKPEVCPFGHPVKSQHVQIIYYDIDL